MDEGRVVLRPSGDSYYAVEPGGRNEFRPLRTAEQRAEDEAVEAMLESVGQVSGKAETFAALCAGVFIVPVIVAKSRRTPMKAIHKHAIDALVFTAAVLTAAVWITWLLCAVTLELVKPAWH